MISLVQDGGVEGHVLFFSCECLESLAEAWVNSSCWVRGTDYNCPGIHGVLVKTLAPWKKSYDKLNILKCRGINLPTKVYKFKAMDFPVVMYRCESWTMKNAEH